jgi:hypothetical protein
MNLTTNNFLETNNEIVNSKKLIFNEKINALKSLKQKKSIRSYKTSLILIILSSILSLVSIISISILQYSNYRAFITNNTNLINKTEAYCFLRSNYIDFVSTPISLVLILIYILLFKRRIFWRNKFRYRNVGLPMIVSCFNKTERLYTCLVYGLISLNVFEIIKSNLEGNSNYSKLVHLNDYTGILRILFNIVEIMIIGLRYYPLLVANRVDSLLINFTSVLSILIDFLANIYKYGQCESISSEDVTIYQVENYIVYYIIYKFLFALPFTIISSILLIEQIYKTICSVIDCIKFRNISSREDDSFCCKLFDLKDDNEFIYSEYDYKYVNSLLSNKYQSNNKNIIKKYIYDWDTNFKFTSRFLNTITVAMITLYYFFINFGYYFIIYSTALVNLIVNVLTSDEKDQKNLANTLRLISILPIFLSLIICIVQLFLLVRETRTYLIQLYKGKCEFLKFVNRKKMIDEAVSNHFSFGGFLVGYLILGYLIMIVFILLFSLLIYAAQLFLKNQFFWLLFKLIIPLATVYVFKVIVSKILCQFFLIRNKNIIGLNNFRAYNVVLYFMFFYNFVLGFLNAFTRVLKAIFVSIFMMSRKFK